MGLAWFKYTLWLFPRLRSMSHSGTGYIVQSQALAGGTQNKVSALMFFITAAAIQKIVFLLLFKNFCKSVAVGSEYTRPLEREEVE